MSRYLVIAFVLVAAACGGAETPAEKPQPQPEPEAQPQAAADPHAVCVQAFQRQRECTDVFIPALVDARVRKDAPPGIAAKDKELGRDQLVAMALEEWKADSTDAAIEQNCANMTGQMPPEQQQQMTEQLGQCLAAETCTAFVDCLMPVVESQLR